ncbi:hypothetical protein ACWKSP_34525 [Micromonosporaceae bacterium Da 78-11]
MRQVYDLAAERELRPRRPDGLINLFSNTGADLRTEKDLDVALDAMATGAVHGQFWADGDVDIYVNWANGTLMWSLDASVPAVGAFRELHARLTGLWLDVAQRLDVEVGRVLDEWSSEQIRHLGMHDAVHPAGGWPAELGWWTYLGPGRDLPAPPLAEVAARTRLLPNGALLVALLDDPAAVDVRYYEDLHTRWLRSGSPGPHRCT